MKEQQKRGRPKIDSSQYRGKIIKVRINPLEERAIHSYCEENNFSVSQLLRNGIDEVLKRKITK